MKLTIITTYSCKKCNTLVCLKHRHPSDHDCTGSTMVSSRPRTGVQSISHSLLCFHTSSTLPEACYGFCQIKLLLAHWS